MNQTDFRTEEVVRQHKHLIELLRHYTPLNVPHLIIYGGTGHGKKIIVNNFIEHLYGRRPAMIQRDVEIDISSNRRVEVSFFECGDVIEITPSEYGRYDTGVVQTVVKQIAETRPLSLFSVGGRAVDLKLLVINDGDRLSKSAQSALRRTVEIYSSNLRIIIICNQLSTIIDPIRSRFVCIRVPGLKFECAELDNETADKINRASNGNIKMAQTYLKNFQCLRDDEKGRKRSRSSAPPYLLDWQFKVIDISETIKRFQSPQVLQSIRNDFSVLLQAGLTSDIILLELVRFLTVDVNFNVYLKIIEKAMVYNERIIAGTRGLFHLEAFAASMLVIFGRENCLC